MSTSQFHCVHCVFETNRVNDWNKHIQSKKHTSNIATHHIQTYDDYLACEECGKLYKHRQSISRHKKNCPGSKRDTNISTAEPEQKSSSPQLMTAELLLQMIQQNHELKTLLVEQNAQLIATQSQVVEHQQLIAQQNNQIVQNTSQMIEHTSHMLQSHNQIASNQTQIMEYCKQPKTIKNNFNLNFFLNVQCKDALNINDFVNNIAVQIADVEAVGRLGYVEGISKIILNALQELDMYKRPIHCTDVKRETLFVKDEDKWNKDDDKQKIKRAIGKVAQKNCKALCDYLTPSMLLSEHPDFDKNMTLMRNINGGDQYAQKSNQEKIIRILSKGVMVEKADE